MKIDILEILKITHKYIPWRLYLIFKWSKIIVSREVMANFLENHDIFLSISVIFTTMNSRDLLDSED